jgi:MFS transporter, BCD family, chlorophyll transporter
MGLWGAAQGIAFGIGGFAGTAASDIARYIIGTPTMAYALVFAVEAALFLFAAVLAWRIGDVRTAVQRAESATGFGDFIKRALAGLSSAEPGAVSNRAKGATS